MEDKLISQKKPFYPITSELVSFLKTYDRWVETPICYSDLLRFSGSVVVYDKKDKKKIIGLIIYPFQLLLMSFLHG